VWIDAAGVANDEVVAAASVAVVVARRGSASTSRAISTNTPKPSLASPSAIN